MTLTPMQTLIIIGMVTIGTMITRFLPFVIFQGTKLNNSYISYLGQVLPHAAVGLLVVYCLKSVNFKSPTYGIPTALAIICMTMLHYSKENPLLSIGIGTVIYMVLVQRVFV